MEGEAMTPLTPDNLRMEDIVMGDAGPERAFDNYPDAFDYCRERNRPVLVIVGDKVTKLMPSGCAYEKGYNPDQVAAMRAVIATSKKKPRPQS